MDAQIYKWLAIDILSFQTQRMKTTPTKNNPTQKMKPTQPKKLRRYLPKIKTTPQKKLIDPTYEVKTTCQNK